jgi:hypothetical protein
MSTLLQHLPFDLQTELGRIDHAAQLKNVHEDLLIRTRSIRKWFQLFEIYPGAVTGLLYVILPTQSEELLSYSWSFGDDNSIRNGYAYHSIKECREKEIELDLRKLKFRVGRLKSVCTPEEWKKIVSEIV